MKKVDSNSHGNLPEPPPLPITRKPFCAGKLKEALAAKGISSQTTDQKARPSQPEVGARFLSTSSLGGQPVPNPPPLALTGTGTTTATAIGQGTISMSSPYHSSDWDKPGVLNCGQSSSMQTGENRSWRRPSVTVSARDRNQLFGQIRHRRDVSGPNPVSPSAARFGNITQQTTTSLAADPLILKMAGR